MQLDSVPPDRLVLRHVFIIAHYEQAANLEFYRLT